MSGIKTCCPNCFGDAGLESIIAGMPNERGRCPICLSENVRLVTASALRDFFAPLIGNYETSEAGRPLVDWLREDWDLFHHPRMEDARAKDLLAEVMNDGEIVRRLLRPTQKYKSDELAKWERLRLELMHENRYFPKTKLDEAIVGKILESLETSNPVMAWYRARLQSDDVPIPIDKMGAPPPRIASHGRANPAGIPYLYLASTPETAVAEIRPHTGERATVAEFAIGKDLELVNLCDPRRDFSPFIFNDEEEIGRWRSYLPLLRRLGEELTRPVVPQSAPFDYVPSQFLCEQIKKLGYDGVLYSSSVGTGKNLALFKPDLAQPKTVAQYSIEKVAATIKALQ